jgi:hypothetical protein
LTKRIVLIRYRNNEVIFYHTIPYFLQ